MTVRIGRVARPQFDFIQFKGGFDTESRSWNVDPGKLRESQNYEIAVNNQGYVDIQGYERFDGRPSPSDSVYFILDVTITGSFSVGDTITQLVSGATAKILAVDTSASPNNLALARITGTFDATNDLQVASTTEGTALSVASKVPVMRARGYNYTTSFRGYRQGISRRY